MTLQEAINHAREKADSSKCGCEHQQLAQWLEELTTLREHNRALVEACKGLLKAHRITVSNVLPDTVMEAEQKLDAIKAAVAFAEQALAAVKEKP